MVELKKLKEIRDELKLIREIVIKKTPNYTINHDPSSWNCSCDGIDYAIKIIDNEIKGEKKK